MVMKSMAPNSSTAACDMVLNGVHVPIYDVW